MARPSSSDGLHSQSGTLDSFNVDKRRLDKRISRDDSWIVTGKAGARTGRPTSNYIEQRYAPTAWAPTPREEQIGMALGSPSFAPPQRNDSVLQNPKSAGSPAMTSPYVAGIDVTSPNAPLPRKASGKWKIFGMFGRRPSESSSQSPAPNQNDMASSKSRPDFPQTPRSQTMPSPQDYGKESKRRPSVSKMRKAKTNQVAPPMPSPYGASSKALDPQDGQSGMLDVNIPSIELERYSVMFEKVLNPSRTSLLSRRQGALEQLKTVGESNEEPRDSAPRKTGQSGSHMLSPHSALTRSNTSPAHLPSPTRANFDQKTSESKLVIAEPSPTPSYNHLRDSPQKGKLTIASLARARGDQRHPPRASYFAGGGEPSPIIESPMELDSPGAAPSDLKASNQTPKQTIYESPPRQIPVVREQQASPTAVFRAPAASTSSSSLISASVSTSSAKHMANSSTSSALTYRTLNSQISLYTDTDVDETDPVMIGGGRDMTPAEVSIARQISVSRQQRQLLQPKLSIVSTHNKSTMVSASRTPRLQASPASGESARMVTPKTATPTLVVPEDPLHSPYVTPLGVARSRKSERIIIDAT
ncbi:hypothetical protein Micbo1qcDRAFT_192416 [Microdochium bolleyi]|uniref:Uncharacterized protein n=1 Tax=Microdochium bolleyi TaxID=196109 RepID=A0A136JE12_9PEZI|nr:hypothetical protein Micbo1qcDRAFT_192416 [Microdochium bolleyi]